MKAAGHRGSYRRASRAEMTKPGMNVTKRRPRVTSLPTDLCRMGCGRAPRRTLDADCDHC